MAKRDREFRYQGRSEKDVRDRANQRGGDFDTFVRDDVKLYKPRDGKNVIRILPPTWDDARHYGYEIWMNYGIGPDNQGYLSLAKMKGEKDPLEDARNEAIKDGDKETADALAPKKRVGIWLIDRLAEDEGPQFWAQPWTVDRDVANLCFDEDTKELILIDDPDKGCDLRFYKEGTGLRTEYPASKMKLLKPGYIAEDEKLQNEWLDYITENPIPEILMYYDYDHINNVFGGTVRGKDDDGKDSGRGRGRQRLDDDDDKPARGRGRSRDEGEEDEKPARGSGRGRGRDEEDEKPARGRGRDRDDDDDDEKPARGRQRLDDDDDKPARGRSRDDDDDDDRGSRTRGRSRDTDDSDDDDRGRGRGRDRDDDDDRGRGRGRGRDEPDDDDRGSGRVRERIREGRGRRGEDD